MKKILNYIKNWLNDFNILNLALIVIIMLRLFNSFAHLDNDLWFILSTGKYVVHHWIPYYDPLAMHEGYVVIIQQWLTASIYYLIYTHLGLKIFSVVLSLLSIAGIYVLYRYSKYLTNNKNLSIILIIFFIYFFLGGFTTSRPQIITYLILTSELFLCEKFYRTNNKKYLYFLPILSILEINLHSSMWFLQFCFLGVYFIDCLKNKKLRRPLFITIIIMLFVGLINPYGIRAITYVFSSYEVSVLNDYINEMKELPITSLTSLITFVSIILMVFLNRNAKEQFPVRYAFLLFGCAYLAFSHIKSLPYLGIALVVCFSYLLRDESIKNTYIKLINKLKNIKLKTVLLFKPRLNFKIFKFGLGIICIFTLFEGYLTSLDSVEFVSAMEKSVDYMDEHVEKKEDITVYTSYEDGGYLEWRGYKPYIDPRGDVFLKSTNKKYDLMDEYVKYTSNVSQISEFLEKYKFDYLVVNSKSTMNKYLSSNKESETHYNEVTTSTDSYYKYILYERVK